MVINFAVQEGECVLKQDYCHGARWYVCSGLFSACADVGFEMWKQPDLWAVAIARLHFVQV